MTFLYDTTMTPEINLPDVLAEVTAAFARYEDALVYQEPPDWHVPARQNLASALLAANRPAEAETVLWEDLKRNAEHGWTLTLLSTALKAQDKFADAALVDARFAKSWKGVARSSRHRRGSSHDALR